ncbi:hypothetical protein BJ508DRAFT_339410 [Ascobolus immersus RN42]|uniref:Uncharacterized protein n=1 Tax=Ascobolus immersus RN42 TaxID=1160509 RepID=A0A3N4IKP8_ASCIM|nr:hypothetical protein BJ508DRAFT_339410 [Ascobolus immersus RN42]
MEARGKVGEFWIVKGVNADDCICVDVGFLSRFDITCVQCVVLIAGIAILVTALLIWMSEKKQAAVGRREMQILLGWYIVISLAEIFSVGGFMNSADLDKVVKGFSAVHIGSITAFFWTLFIFAIVKFQYLDDGTLLSIGLVLGSGLIIFAGTGYIALDTAFQWTSQFVYSGDYKNLALYVLYLIEPLIMIALYVILATIVVLMVLGERKPMLLLGLTGLLFAIGQIFNFVASVHICNATNGKIDGSLFQTLFSLLSVTSLWFFWTLITEDSWNDGPQPDSGYA